MRPATTLEQLVRDQLAAEHLTPTSWGNAPGDRYAPHRHDYDKVLVGVSGSIVFILPELGRSVDLRAGDRLDLPARTLHAASVGPHGVRCLEAHLPPGQLDVSPRVTPGWADAPRTNVPAPKTGPTPAA
jgi:quercetin dioxygenase-like cupin family protein